MTGYLFRHNIVEAPLSNIVSFNQICILNNVKMIHIVPFLLLLLVRWPLKDLSPHLFQNRIDLNITVPVKIIYGQQNMTELIQMS